MTTASATKSRGQWQQLEFQICLLAVLIVTLPLFFIKSFYVDWLNHVWMVSYYGHHFRHHFTFPAFLDVQDIETGYPRFYGFLFYSLMGLIEAIVGADLAIRLGVIALLLATAGLWYRLGSNASQNKLAGTLLGVAPVLSVYGLTNLYSRSALTEFFAVGFAYLSLGFFLEAFIVPSGKNQEQETDKRFGLAFLFLALVIGTHPITGYLEIICTSLPMLILLVMNRTLFSSCTKRRLILYLGLFLFVTAPFVYNVVSYQQYLPILEGSLPEYIPSYYDHPLARLLPYLIDRRTFGTLKTVSTPFLDANASYALLMIGIAMTAYLIRRKHDQSAALVYGSGMIAVVILTTLLSLDVSLYTGLSSVEFIVRALFHPIQQIYRLVSWLNILMVLAIIVPLILANKTGAFAALMRDKRFELLTTIAIGIMFCAVLPKIGVLFLAIDDIRAQSPMNFPMQQGELANANDDYFKIIGNTGHTPVTFYGLHGYLMSSAFYKVPDNPLLPVTDVVLHEDRKTYRAYRAAPERVYCNSPCYLHTNIFSSKFITLIHDGQPVPPEDIVRYRGRLTLYGHPGWNEVSFYVSPWEYLGRTLTVYLWLGWAFYLVGWRQLRTKMVRWTATRFANI